jgi:hypothetical protein
MVNNSSSFELSGNLCVTADDNDDDMGAEVEIEMDGSASAVPPEHEVTQPFLAEGTVLLGGLVEVKPSTMYGSAVNLSDIWSV